MSLNKCILHGKLLKDIECMATRNGKAYATFSIGVQRDYKKPDAKYAESDIVNCRAWGNVAQFISKYAMKGDFVLVQGRWTVDQYEKDGEKKTNNYLLIEIVEPTRANGEKSASGFKRPPLEKSSFDSMGEVEPSVEGLDW